MSFARIYIGSKVSIIRYLCKIILIGSHLKVQIIRHIVILIKVFSNVYKMFCNKDFKVFILCFEVLIYYTDVGHDKYFKAFHIIMHNSFPNAFLQCIIKMHFINYSSFPFDLKPQLLLLYKIYVSTKNLNFIYYNYSAIITYVRL